MSERPVEPHNTSENPEAWAEIAQWESDRADILREALERIATFDKGDGSTWRTIGDAPAIARDAILRAGKEGE